MTKKLKIIILHFCILSLITVSEAWAQFPEKPITIINSNKPGGAIDIMTRKMAMIANKYDDVIIVVENMPGGSGTAAMSYVQNKSADGYTLLATLKSYISTGLLNNTGPTIDDFQIVACLVYDWEVLITNGKSDVITFEDIKSDAEKKKGEQKWLGPNTGGMDHLMALETWEKCGIHAKWIPFEGSSVSIAALLGGNGSVYVGNAVDTKGRPDLKIAAVAAPERLKEFPLTPTFKELGYDLTQQMWRGISAKKGTPEHVIKYLEDLLYKVSQDEEWISFVKSGFAEPVFFNNEEMRGKINEDKALAKELLLRAKIISEDSGKQFNYPDWMLFIIVAIVTILILTIYAIKRWKIDSEFFIFQLLISFPVFFIYKTFGFPSGGATGDYGPAFIPRILTFILLVLSLSLLSKRLLSNTEKKTTALNNLTVFKSIALIILYIVMIALIGFYISSLLFMITMLRVFAFKRIVPVAAISVGSLVIIFLIFEKLLQVNLPSGILF